MASHASVRSASVHRRGMRRSAANLTVSNAVNAGSIMSSWNTIPTSFLPTCVFSPFTSRSPETCDVSMNPATTVRRLVLPLPLGPINAETVPGRNDVVTPWITRLGVRLPFASLTTGAYLRSTRSTRTRRSGVKDAAASSNDAVDADGRISSVRPKCAPRTSETVCGGIEMPSSKKIEIGINGN